MRHRKGLYERLRKDLHREPRVARNGSSWPSLSVPYDNLSPWLIRRRTSHCCFLTLRSDDRSEKAAGEEDGLKESRTSATADAAETGEDGHLDGIEVARPSLVTPYFSIEYKFQLRALTRYSLGCDHGGA